MTLASDIARAVVLAVGLGCVSGVAAAQPSASDAQMRTVARDLAQQGAEAFERGNFEVALDRFTRAEAVFRAPSLTIMRARSLRSLGRLVESVDAYEETQRATIPPGAPEAYRRAVADARREGLEVSAIVPRLLIRIRTVRSEDARVKMDGVAVPAALLDVERPIDPGQHEIYAAAPGKHPVIRRVSVAEGERVVVELRFDEARAVQQSARTNAEPSPSPPGSGKRIAGFVGLGVGAAGLAIGGITGLIALDKQAYLDSKCRPNCPEGAEDDIDSFRLNRTLSYGGFAVGVVAAGIGGYLLLTSSPSGEHVAVRVSPASVGVGGRF